MHSTVLHRCGHTRESSYCFTPVNYAHSIGGQLTLVQVVIFGVKDFGLKPHISTTMLSRMLDDNLRGRPCIHKMTHGKLVARPDYPTGWLPLSCTPPDPDDTQT